MRRSTHFQRGQTLPLAALCLVLLFAVAALVVDSGYMEYKQRVQQTAADSAAIAGGWALIAGSDVTTAAKTSTATNGFTHDGTNVIVTATSPPASGPNSGNNSAVEVNVTANYAPIFSGLLGRSHNTVSTRAVAVVESNPSGPCIWAIAGDFQDNQGSVSGPCGILASKDVQDNSSTMNIPSIGAEGHVSSSPSGVVVSEGIPSFSDPCSTVPGCKALATEFPAGPTPGTGPYTSCQPAPVSGSQLIGGCYAGLPDGGNFNLQPGLYIFTGNVGKTNGVSLTCSSCVTGSSGVTLVLGGDVNFNGANATLIAPPAYQGAGSASITSAGAPGVLLYITSHHANANFSNLSMLGMVYGPDAHINFNGGGSGLTVTFVVGADIVANKATITIPSSGSSSPVQVPVLSE